ncbi:hypothetical protein BDV98DRAFT_507616 [Pterulicium gracile]|uniref:AN1-type domain-containing protein n=1 Tax=Pterulicium gracile TaxID=1884261 RepID=A0A5C3QLC0_9AGAR|nr:hypothetical protein BDV98DRAFT_507616 [Pterula gracilis]
MTTTPNDTSLLDIGKKCSHTHCGTIDFLPFKCEHCTQPFCADHFRVDDHKCSHYDASKHNRVAPHCPLCDEPIAIPPGQDPIYRLQDHVDNKCPVMTGKKPGSTSPRCGNKRCNKVLIQPIRCDQCRMQFCPSHRWPSDHTCVNTAPSTPPSKSPGASFTTASEGVKKSAADVGAKATAASAAIKRSMANASANSNAKPASASSPKSPPIDNPFSKTNRRAKAENESRYKAMERRAQKGLLSEQEKVIFAEEQAARGKSSAKGGDGKGKDCVVM